MTAAITLHTGDITTVSTDAIVNAANSSLLGGGGVDGAIHAAAGPGLLADCRRVREQQYPNGLPAGAAVATAAGNLPSRWVIHTVGPVYSRREDRSATLSSCYTSSLALARELGADSIAFPLVSAGVYGWPVDDAARLAVQAIRASTDTDGLASVLLVAFNGAANQAISAALAD